MDVTIQENEKILTVIFHGRLDSLSVPEAESEILPLMNQKEFETIILDCHELSYISSSGLRLIFTILKNEKMQGGRVILKDVNGFVNNILNSTGLAAMFEFE